MNGIVLAGVGIGAGFFYWLGLRDAGARVSGLLAGARATGIMLFAGIALSVLAGWYGLAGLALSAAYLLGWLRARHLATHVR